MLNKIKDAPNSQLITEFVGLNPNMDSYQRLKDPLEEEAVLTTKKQAKCRQRAAVAKLGHHQFKAQLDHPE